MIVLLTARYHAGSKKDAQVLRGILEALGMEGGRSGKDAKRDAAGASARFSPARCHFQIVPRAAGCAETDLSIHVSDPLLAAKIVKQNGGRIIAGLSDRQIAEVGFSVQLPSGGTVHFGTLSGDPDTVELPGLAGNLKAGGKRFGIVVARFNAFITERLLQAAFDGLLRSGARREDITILRVPGAFEIPSASRMLAETRKYDAIVCIGCLLRGDTAHYDVIVNEVTRGIGQSAQATGIPHAFGVLTCDTLEQAIDRAGLKMGNKGLEAATAAIEMANLGESLRSLVPKVSNAKSGKKKLPPKKTSKTNLRRKKK